MKSTRRQRALGLLSPLLTALAITAASGRGHAQMATATPVAEPGVDGVTLHLSWPQPTTVQVESAPGEVLLTSDQPLDTSALAPLSTTLAPWLLGMQAGYDTLLLRLRPGVRAASRATESGVVVTLRTAARAAAAATATPAAPTPQQAAAAKTRLRRLKASLLWSLGEVWQARNAFAALAAEAPEDVDVWRGLSVVEARLGRWRQATAAHDHAQRISGGGGRDGKPLVGTDDAERAIATLRFDVQHGAATRLGFGGRGHAFVGPGLRVGVDAELARVRPAAASPFEASLDERPDPVGRVAIVARQDARSGSWIQLGLSGGTSPLGGALQLSHWDRWGSTALQLSLREPRWELPIFAGLGAHRDAIDLRREFRALPTLGRALRGDLQIVAMAQLERWRLADIALTRSDWALSASLRYVSWRSHPRIFVDYTVRHVSATAAASGTALAALVVDSHLHQPTVGLQWTFLRWLNAEAAAGYGVNLLGPDAFALSASLRWRPPAGLLASLAVQHGLQPAAIAASLTTVTAQIGATF